MHLININQLRPNFVRAQKYKLKIKAKKSYVK
jgi:hypothetical protein